MNLETGDNPAWNCLIGQYKHLSQVMFQCKDTYLNEEREEHSGILQILSLEVFGFFLSKFSRHFRDL